MDSTEKYAKYYFVDYENVHQSGLNGIENLTENDVLVIFYTVNAESLTFPVYESLMKCRAEIKLYNVECGGKNALDFQLSSYIGYMAGKNPDAECHIISNDRGYEYVISFWKEKNVTIKMSSDVAGNIRKLLPAVIPAVKKEVRTVTPAPEKSGNTPAENFDEAVKPLHLAGETKNRLCSMFYSVKNGSDPTPEKLYSILRRHFSTEESDRYYKALKHLTGTETTVSVPDRHETDFDIAVKPLKLSAGAKQKLLDIYNTAVKLDSIVKTRQHINNEIGKTFGTENQKNYYSVLKPLIK